MEKIDIEKLSTRELLDYREFTEILYDFYDNEAKANTGDYANEDNEAAFKAASKECLKYLGIKEKLLKEIKKRTDELA